MHRLKLHRYLLFMSDNIPQSILLSDNINATLVSVHTIILPNTIISKEFLNHPLNMFSFFYCLIIFFMISLWYFWVLLKYFSSTYLKHLEIKLASLDCFRNNLFIILLLYHLMEFFVLQWAINFIKLFNYKLYWFCTLYHLRVLHSCIFILLPAMHCQEKKGFIPWTPLGCRACAVPQG